MLSKQNRLPLRTEFNRLKKEGRVFQGKLFSLLVADQRPKTKDQRPKFAFIISKKIDKRATERNRGKRLLSESVRGFLPQIKSGVEGVFLAKKAIAGKELKEIKDGVKMLFGKAGLLKE